MARWSAAPSSPSSAWGAVVALIAFITSIVGVARSRARFVPALVLLAALVLPAVATGYGIQQGGEALYKQTLADAQGYIGQIDTGDVNALYDRFKAFGVNLPGRQQIIDVLNGVGRGEDGVPGGATEIKLPAHQVGFRLR